MRQKLYNYSVLGFPVVIVNPVLKKSLGEVYLDIDHKKFTDTVFRLLIYKPARLSGAELRFIRQHMHLSQDEFVRKVFYGEIDRATLSRYEGKKLNASSMNASQESVVRARMIVFALRERPSVKKYFTSVVDNFATCQDVGEPIRIGYDDVA